ncbi:hypothetical protein [Caballeronia sp. AZ1_KS37]|uniref:hypothetical protein n=1 Tax=Caballeronia sp. AZ1_KS37 TaxID=2921756 RepID=UPI0020281753|nr:hypothetical protein [Caballeronia sp. AZ1_KS37]
MRKLSLSLLCMLPCVASAATTPEPWWSNFVPRSSGDWAAWFQAVASVIAIVAATIIAGWQGRQMKKQRTADVEDKIKAFHQILQAAVEWQGKISGLLATPEGIGTAINTQVDFMPEIIGIERALQRIELHTLPDGLVVHTITVSSTFTRFREVVQETISKEVPKRTSMGFREKMHNMNTTLDRTFKAIEAQLDPKKAGRRLTKR